MRRRDLLLGAAGCGLWGCRPPVDAYAHIRGAWAGVAIERGHVLRQAQAPVYQDGPTHRVHTLIVGAGVAGLSAARALRAQGHDDFAVLELEDHAGGNARAGSIAGIAHPLGAHYLPVPGDDAPEVQDFLEELGLRLRVSGRWVYDEQTLCHSPRERLFLNGSWQDGLLPMQGVGASTLVQYRRFAALVAQWQASGVFSMPLRPNALEILARSPLLAASATQVFATYLASQGLVDQHLLWYLDYCCLDDYGAGIDAVSTFAGLHYFAARHGFSVPGDEAGEHEGLLTWPQGNAFLTQALAHPLQARLQTGCVVLRIEERRHDVVVDALQVASGQVHRYTAQRSIVALPVHVAARVVVNPPDFLRLAARHTAHSSWWVANIHLEQPLRQNAQGAFPSWDNVLYDQNGLGYVDAMHQSTRIAPGPTVLTYYQALGLSARPALLQATWPMLRDQVLTQLSVAHPDLAQCTGRIDVTRYGHAMAVPTPYFLSTLAPLFSQGTAANLSKKYPPCHTPTTPRLHFAHSDWSGYSVFEEAFTRGWHAATVRNSMGPP